MCTTMLVPPWAAAVMIERSRQSGANNRVLHIRDSGARLYLGASAAGRGAGTTLGPAGDLAVNGAKRKCCSGSDSGGKTGADNTAVLHVGDHRANLDFGTSGAGLGAGTD